MVKVNCIEELIDGIASIRNLKKGFITNFFLDYVKHSLWIENGDCFSIRIGDTFFIIKTQDSFWNVFYNSTDIESLTQDLNQLGKQYPEITTVIDLVSKNEVNEPLLTHLQSCGYTTMCTLVRMSRPTAKVEYQADFTKVKQAEISQAKEIRTILFKYFDKELEQIPYLEEIEELIRMGQVLIYLKSNGSVGGFIIYEQNKTTWHLRYWFVMPELRETKIGGLLCRKAFYESNSTKRQMLWVMKSNSNSVTRYIHYGFREDGLYDNILVRGKFYPNLLSTNNLTKAN